MSKRETSPTPADTGDRGLGHDDARAMAIDAQAKLHHAYFLGLQLRVAVNETPEVVYEWMFRLFRQQHEDKFLTSFDKLGLTGLPDAVACARYHVLSNGIGGVPVEYAEESDRKAWVRFRYPRWMFAGPTVCGMPVETGRGFLHGWYAQNGVSLKNPRLGFVCVSEDVTGEFGLCGYFYEYDEALAPQERLRFAKDERPPPYDPAAQPAPPPGEWTAERLAKANRNYAVEYVRNGIASLIDVVGEHVALAHAEKVARLIGLQYGSELAQILPDGQTEPTAPAQVAAWLAELLRGMGDEADVVATDSGAALHQHGLRIVRGLEAGERQALLRVWAAMWRGVVDSRRTFFATEMTDHGDRLVWRFSLR